MIYASYIWLFNFSYLSANNNFIFSEFLFVCLFYHVDQCGYEVFVVHKYLFVLRRSFFCLIDLSSQLVEDFCGLVEFFLKIFLQLNQPDFFGSDFQGLIPRVPLAMFFVFRLLKIFYTLSVVFIYFVASYVVENSALFGVEVFDQSD